MKTLSRTINDLTAERISTIVNREKPIPKPDDFEGTNAEWTEKLFWEILWERMMALEENHERQDLVIDKTNQFG